MSTIQKECFDPKFTTTTEEIHLIPCRFEHEGPAPVSKYFVEEGNTSTLRGRKLLKARLDLPKDYQFVIIQQENQNWIAKGKQDHLIVWHPDENPTTSNCNSLNLKGVVELATLLHSKVE
jgi:hypothetical protein